MDHEMTRNIDDDIEDGELTNSDDGYTPLERPRNSSIVGPQRSIDGGVCGSSTSSATATVAVTRMDETSEQDSLPEPSSDSSESDTEFTSKAKLSKLRIKSYNNDRNTLHIPPKKYNIWSTDLQEETLLENLKGCGVDKSTACDRSVESYDYNLKYRLNGENSLKRRQSNSDDSDKNFDSSERRNKRFRGNTLNYRNKKDIRSRLGNKSDDSSSIDGLMHQPRTIVDLNILVDTSDEDIARQIANHLYEKKDDLMLRVVEILGREIPIELFNETKKIESTGGMLILNGKRRRTPGGVFLFLLKNSETIEKELKTQIFLDDAKRYNKEQKNEQALQRDRKVAELKKSLKEESNELNTLATRSDLVLTHLNAETHANLSNPPPSPVTDCNQENSSDFDTNDIRHVNVTSPEKMFTKSDATKCYDDDFLDVNCDPMDLF